MGGAVLGIRKTYYSGRIPSRVELIGGDFDSRQDAERAMRKTVAGDLDVLLENRLSGSIYAPCFGVRGHDAAIMEISTAGSNGVVDGLAAAVIAGMWGNGLDRKRRLAAAGYNYEVIQKRVNEIMRSSPVAGYDIVIVKHGCPFCTEDAEGFVKKFGAYAIHGRMLCTGHCEPQEINFCPQCGRKLWRRI